MIFFKPCETMQKKPDLGPMRKALPIFFSFMQIFFFQNSYNSDFTVKFMQKYSRLFLNFLTGSFLIFFHAFLRQNGPC